MRIEQSNVAMNACRDFSSECEVRLDTQYSFRSIFEGLSQVEESAGDDKADRDMRVLRLIESLLERMLELLSGKGQEVQLSDLRDVTADGVADKGKQVRGSRVAVMEWRSEFTEKISEHERTAFSSSGTVLTADGRKLEFSVGLEMCRDFNCERKVVDSGVVELRDPLVVNFDGKATELSGARFEFDLDADGKTEKIIGLGAGSGFLAIDNNGDGKINDGSELFGTLSGNGFADLARFDKDGNRWLDENDAAFANLKIWQRDTEGKDSLRSLSDSGIGALYLDFADTPFALTDDENRLLAQIRASGVYLRENGSPGSLQQIDLAV